MVEDRAWPTRQLHERRISTLIPALPVLIRPRRAKKTLTELGIQITIHPSSPTFPTIQLGGRAMAIRRLYVYAASALSVLLPLSGAHAQTTGGVPSEGPGGSAPAATN